VVKDASGKVRRGRSALDFEFICLKRNILFIVIKDKLKM